MSMDVVIRNPAIRMAVIGLWGFVLALPFKGPGGAAVFSAALLVFLGFASLLKRVPFPALPIPSQLAALSSRQQKSLAALVLAILVLLPFLLNAYLIDILIIAVIYALLAMGLNVIVGFTGLLNLGFAAFFAVGAYTYGLLNTRLDLGFWVCLPIAPVAAAGAGVLLAIPALRLKGDYLAIVTLGFGEITRLVLVNWDSLTGGPNGITGIDSPSLGILAADRLTGLYYLATAAALIALFVIRRVEASRIGRAWKAIRENEIAAASVGIDTTRYKLFAIGLGTFWGGLAGILFAAKMQFISPESFTFMESVLILSMVILGGLGNTMGAVLGAFILVFLPEALREVNLYRMLLLGAGLVLLMRFRPQGLLGGR